MSALNMDNKSKIGFFMSIFALIGLFLIFADDSTHSSLDSFFTKPYITIPLASITGFIIAHYFHRKNKPVQEFWEKKRHDVIYDTCNSIQQIQISLKSIEKHIVKMSQIPTNEIQVSFDSEMKKLKQYAILHNQYLTNMEARQIQLIAEDFHVYVLELIHPTNQSQQIKEHRIITLESVIYRLITNFRTVPASQKLDLMKPISNYFITDEIISSRHRLHS